VRGSSAWRAVGPAPAPAAPPAARPPPPLEAGLPPAAAAVLEAAGSGLGVRPEVLARARARLAALLAAPTP
jgi:hypothetical protein